MHQESKTILILGCLEAGLQVTGNKLLTIQFQFSSNSQIVILLKVSGWTTQVTSTRRELRMQNTELKIDFIPQELMT